MSQLINVRKYKKAVKAFPKMELVTKRSEQKRISAMRGKIGIVVLVLEKIETESGFDLDENFLILLILFSYLRFTFVRHILGIHRLHKRFLPAHRRWL